MFRSPDDARHPAPARGGASLLDTPAETEQFDGEIRDLAVLRTRELGEVEGEIGNQEGLPCLARSGRRPQNRSSANCQEPSQGLETVGLALIRQDDLAM